MIIELELPDSVYRQLGASPNAKIVALVERFATYGATDKVVVLTPTQVREIQELSGESVASLSDGGAIVGLFKRLTGINLGGVRWQFPPDVLERVKDYAEFNGKDLKTYIRELVEQTMRQATGTW